MAATKTKVVTVRRTFLGIGQNRALQREINKMARKGWTYRETVKSYRGYELMFVKD